MTDALLNLVQWPAMLVTMLSTWLVASQSRHKRMLAFWLFIVSNVLWVVWGVYAQAYALIVLQAFLFIMNARGVRKNETDGAS